MKQRWSVLATGAAIMGLMVLPAQAGAAPTVSGLAACYTAGMTGGVPEIPVTLSGGTPNDSFLVLISPPKGPAGGLGSSTGTYDTNGDGSTTLNNIYPPHDSAYPLSGERANLSVRDTTDPTAPATPLGSILITKRSLDLGFNYVGDNRPHDVTVSGTQFANQKLYGFIVHRGKVVRRMSLGRANACGYTKALETITPKHTPLGRYVFYVNAGTQLNKKAALSQAYTVELR